eukprot:4915292-Pyramimonas_sp.AAC.1
MMDGSISMSSYTSFRGKTDVTRQDGHNPRMDEAKIIAETFYKITSDQMAAIVMAIVPVREADGEEKQRLQFKVRVRDSGTADLFIRASQGH